VYLDFYRLTREPFRITPDPEFLYLGPVHKEALAAIAYGVEQRKGILAVTRGGGDGKDHHPALVPRQGRPGTAEVRLRVQPQRLLPDPAADDLPGARDPPGERPSNGFEVAAEDEMVALSRNIDALLTASPRNVVQFIGAQGGEGSSTVTRDFAMVSAARLGKSVLLLDADPRNPSQHLFFRLEPEFGWGEILRNRRTFRKAIRRIGKTKLYVYPTPPGSAPLPEALFSPEIKEFWDAAKERFDLVLIDSAPASASPDGLSMSRYVDGVVLVLEAEKTRKPVAENLKNRIRQNGGNLLGMVFNNRRCHIPEFLYKRL